MAHKSRRKHFKHLRKREQAMSREHVPERVEAERAAAERVAEPHAPRPLIVERKR